MGRSGHSQEAGTRPQTHPRSELNAPPPSGSHRCQDPHRSHWSPGVGAGKEEGIRSWAPEPSAPGGGAWPPASACGAGRWRGSAGPGGVTHRTPVSLDLVSRGGEQEATVAPTPSPCSASRRAPRPHPVTYHRHGQLQAQGSPADDQGQHPQQADPWGRDSQSALSRLG